MGHLTRVGFGSWGSLPQVGNSSLFFLRSTARISYEGLRLGGGARRDPSDAQVSGGFILINQVVDRTFDVTSSVVALYDRLLPVRVEWRRGVACHPSLMSLDVASAAVVARSSLLHLGPNCASWVACWIPVPLWIADLGSR
ncbi:hypothetical protein GW17_00046363 [Ensete ventricosum]|nr:hypothetical protein GW17_00046363 [Ensete ventricosum]